MKTLFSAVLVGVIALGSATPASAQLLFKPKPRVNPSQRVPELIITLKTEGDERKRAKAAEELRDYDANIYGEIVAVLADTLLTDKKQSVRLEALASLSRIRPVNAIAGQAMEKAAASDESLRVRFQARTALTKYHLSGYSAKRKGPDGPPTVSLLEPPLAPSVGLPRIDSFPLPAPAVTNPSTPRPLPAGVATPAKKTTGEPPLQGPSLFP